MKCPYCGYEESRVIDSRSIEDRIRRRRECLKCNRRFTTYEIVEATPIMVVKRDGSRQMYSREKVMNGLIRSCEKRPIEMAELDRAANNVERELMNTMEREVPSSLIGDLVMDELKSIDEVAYVRFASVYREFKDINTFMCELKTLLKQSKKASNKKSKKQP